LEAQPLSIVETSSDTDSSDDLARVLEAAGEDVSSLADRSKPPKWCKYNLKSFTRYEWHWQKEYEVFRDPHYPHLWFGKGPDSYYKYNLHSKFQRICGGPPNKPKILSFYLNLPKNKKRYVEGCIGHFDSSEVEFPHVTAYDCNGTAVRCLWHGFKFNKPLELLIVWSPDSSHSPDAYWLRFSSHSAPHDFCESYPFFEDPA